MVLWFINKEIKNNSIFSSSQKILYSKIFLHTNETFFHLFIHTKVYDKITNEDIEKHGILLRSWNPITKRGQRYVFRKGEEGDGDLNLHRIHLPNTKTIFEFSTVDNINKWVTAN
jgi:hypothetical protein